MDKPTVGRVVHYLLDEIHFSATIVHVWDDLYVNLAVLDNNLPSSPREIVFAASLTVQDETKKTDKSWHWPERN